MVQAIRITLFAVFLMVVFSACNDEPPAPAPPSLEIRGADMSFLPEVRQSGLVIRNSAGQPEDMLVTLNNAGVNVVRLRLWNNPATPVSGFESVRALSAEIKNRGMKVMITLHYSDSWADPGKQSKPALWQALPFNVLLDSVYQFTRKVAGTIRPEYISIGNEINGGLLWPDGRSNQPAQMRAILERGIQAVRRYSPESKIILHYAGHRGANNFFSGLAGLDYDIIGISYYPKWHGANLTELRQNLGQTALKNQKPIFIAEVSYPFTLDWNDWTNNVVGETAHLVDGFPATPAGQRDFLKRIRDLITDVPNGLGLVYWGAEWISYRGPQATDGSTWENQALWDFNNRALPAITVFAE
jgi:arabinogalactan endo-1,4-beta-galactosidase